MAASGHFGSPLCVINGYAKFVTQLEMPQAFWAFLYKMAARGHFVFPIDDKNHRVLVIWDLNGCQSKPPTSWSFLQEKVKVINKEAPKNLLLCNISY